ncbi:MAG: acyloxyacyl hydrolase [Phycisphaerales bacterium]
MRLPDGSIEALVATALIALLGAEAGATGGVLVPTTAAPIVASARTLEETLQTPIAGPSDVKTPEIAAPLDASVPVAHKRFGEMDSIRLNLLGGYGTSFDDTQYIEGTIGLSWFFVDNVSLDLELMGLGIDQDRGDTGAINGSLLFRWHFLVHESWTMYFEGGCGLLYAGNNVPPDGTQFNFTPQVGFGFTYDLGNDVRLMTGTRWFHMSNARLSASNPGVDTMLFYAGVSLGF